MLIHILVGNKHALQSIKNLSSVAIVVSDNVLVNNNANTSLELNALGSGDMVVMSIQKLQIGSISIFAGASGGVGILASLINATKSISAISFGSGEVATSPTRSTRTR